VYNKVLGLNSSVTTVDPMSQMTPVVDSTHLVEIYFCLA